MTIPLSVMQTLSAMIIDGVMDRFPRLKFGVIELGASWLPGWMKSMDSAHLAFFKNEERLHRLSATPSEIVRRQVRVTPYPHENAGWLIGQAGPETCLFSSDFPHVEGGRNPLKRFGDSLVGIGPEAMDAFYAGNFIDLMGQGLTAELRRPRHLAAA
jgi:predicted TIM-barrel fold metal-dependent hydrolase